MMPEMDVTVFERSSRVLSKVAISGGGRCNCTNSFEGVNDLSAVYPRGHRLMKRLFHTFDFRDAYKWFESRGVPLVTQEDHCVFPAAQDSHAVIGCFMALAERHGIEIRTGCKVQSISDVDRYDYVVVTTGGSPSGEGLRWLADMGHEIVRPVPSLFSFATDDDRQHALMGLVKDVEVLLPGTKYKAGGPMLITHWGLSGPAVLKLSSYAARHLAECGYRQPMGINWLCGGDDDAEALMDDMKRTNAHRQVMGCAPAGFQHRLWEYLMEKALGAEAARKRWGDLNRKETNRLRNVLVSDVCRISGRTKFKDEFVTCGGVSLAAVHADTLQSKCVSHLYFAGEVLDIDGITGGFNFQAAWTTAYVVARAISQSAQM